MKDINVDIECKNLDEFVEACDYFETVRKLSIDGRREINLELDFIEVGKFISFIKNHLNLQEGKLNEEEEQLIRNIVRGLIKKKATKVIKDGRLATSIIELEREMLELDKQTQDKRKEIVKESVYNMFRLNNHLNIFGVEENKDTNKKVFTIKKEDIFYILEQINYDMPSYFTTTYKIIE